MMFDDLDRVTPQELGVPHPSWRPNQYTAYTQILRDVKSKPDQFIFAQLPTGSGKSAIPTALGHDERVVVYVHSLALLDQYEAAYGFSIVKGMANYPCVNPEVASRFEAKWQRAPTVAECPFSKKMDCPVYDQCLYIIARNKALASRRMACTYPFALLSHSIRQRGGIAVWDEAHMAPKAILNYAETGLSDGERKDWQLDPFPMYGIKDGLGKNGRKILLDWVWKAKRVMEDNKPPDSFPEDVSMWQKTARKLDTIIERLEMPGIDYYYEHDVKDVDRTWRGKRVRRKYPYILVKPFSASVDRWKISDNKSNLLMSATLGAKVEPLADELGIKYYAFYDYPHPVPKDKRPVYRIEFDRMTWGNLNKAPALYRLQAKKIADFIETFPDTWTGIVVTSSYEKADQLYKHLRSFLGSRVQDGRLGVHTVMTAVPGTVIVGVIQVWGTGLDLKGDLGRFAIVAGVPFGNLTDSFELARKTRVGANFAWWESYVSVPQAVGRVSRGEIGTDGEYELNVGALADGSAYSPKALSNYPSWFTEAIIPF